MAVGADCSGMVLEKAFGRKSFVRTISKGYLVENIVIVNASIPHEWKGSVALTEGCELPEYDASSEHYG